MFERILVLENKIPDGKYGFNIENIESLFSALVLP
jgi:hypothetical protein